MGVKVVSIFLVDTSLRWVGVLPRRSESINTPSPRNQQTEWQPSSGNARRIPALRLVDLC